MRSTASTAALTLAALFILFGPAAGPAYAAIRHVPSAYPTIQAAINAAVDGDTIAVAPGVYPENLDVNKKLSIVGSGSGTNPLVDTIVDPTGGLYGMFIHQPVNLANLRVTGAPNHGIRVQSTAGRLAFAGVTWENIVVAANGAQGVELHNGTDVSAMSIVNSAFVQNIGIGLRSASDVTINGMGITDCTFDQNLYGLYLQGTINDLTIAGSSFNLNTAWGLYMSETGSIAGVVIENSSFDGNVGWGLVLYTGSSITDVSVTRSSIDNAPAPGYPAGKGLWVGAEGTVTNIAATCDWWGAADGPGPVGPGSGDAVGSGVAFTPWLTGSDLEGACSGGTPRGIKQLVKIDLGTLSIDKHTDHKIAEAIRHIENSLKANLWEDDSHLTAKGQKVFEEEKHAVQKLLEIKNPTASILDAIDALVSADSILASLAVTEADGTLGVDPKDLAKAYDELGKANGYVGTSTHEKAIEHFKKAWHHAMKAIKKAVDE